MLRRKVLLLVLLVFLAFIAMGQLGGCQCPIIPILGYEYRIPYFTANNFPTDNSQVNRNNVHNVDRIALFCFVEVEYYDSGNNLLQANTQRKYLARLILGDTVFGSGPVIEYPNPSAATRFVRDSMQLNIPINAVKARVKFHVGAHYLINDFAPNLNDDDYDDGIEALAKNFYLGFNRITGWQKIEEDTYGVHEAIAEIIQDGDEILHGKFIGGYESDTDQGWVTFAAQVPLR